MWDALIIGAGPAGALSAYLLARAGHKVLLVDKAHFPRAKVCGCCLGGTGIASLNAAGLGDLPGQLGAIPLKKIVLHSGGQIAEIATHGSVCISRELLDFALVKEAERAGAEFWPAVTATIQAEMDFVTGELSDHSGSRQVTARIALVATGLAGAAQREFAIEPGSRIGAGALLAPGSFSYFRPGVVYMTSTERGYVGVVCLEDGRLDVAAALDPLFARQSKGLGAAAVSILSQSPWPVPPNLQAGDWKGTSLLSRRPRAISGHRWFALGDAAGYVEPFTGEGMGWALASALTLAPLASAAIKKWSPNLARAWSTAHRRLLRHRQKTCWLISRGLRWPTISTALVRAISWAPRLADPILWQLNRPPALLGASRS